MKFIGSIAAIVLATGPLVSAGGVSTCFRSKGTANTQYCTSTCDPTNGGADGTPTGNDYSRARMDSWCYLVDTTSDAKWLCNGGQGCNGIDGKRCLTKGEDATLGGCGPSDY